MSRKSLYIIVTLMSFALVGLIYFQFYWITSLMTENEERFKKDVVAALKTVSSRLERKETFALLNQRLNYLPTPYFSRVASGGATFQFEVKDSLSVIQDFSFYMDVNSTGSYVLEPSTGRPSENTPTRPGFRSNVSEQDLQKVSYKSDLMFSVLQEMVLAEHPIRSRVSTRHLDSLLTDELLSLGIDIDFNYGILTPYEGQFVYVKTPDDKGLIQSEFKAKLFPNDLVGGNEVLVIDFPGKREFLLGKIWVTSTSSGILLLVIMFCFGYSIHTILKQKRLSEIKNDFVNNMTHELKTPIATVGLAIEALRDKSLQTRPDRREKYLSIIGEENNRLGQHVEKVLQMAGIERRDLKMKEEVLHLHELILAAVDKINLQIDQRQGKIRTILNANDDMVKGDSVHFLNVVLNLLENAIKYSEEAPDIVLRTEKSGTNIVMSVQDHGIGMTKETLKQIFQKFYRVPTGNVHNVKGFGLGLAYVKQVVEQHRGRISVESDLGKGSKFFIFLPNFHGDI